MRLDFARLWNRTTGEVLRIRPGMFGSEKLEHIGRLSDGRVVLTTLRSHVGQVVHFPADFWNFSARPVVRKLWSRCDPAKHSIPTFRLHNPSKGENRCPSLSYELV